MQKGETKQVLRPTHLLSILLLNSTVNGLCKSNMTCPIYFQDYQTLISKKSPRCLIFHYPFFASGTKVAPLNCFVFVETFSLSLNK